MQLFINDAVKAINEKSAYLINTFFFKPVDNSPLILFRILFGVLIFMECIGSILTGWVKKVFIDPEFTFPFIDFYWLHPLPGNGMYIYYVLMGITGLMIMLGFFYRIGTISFFILWTASYLMQKSLYNNHYYMLVLLSLLMVFMPAEKYFSLDVKQKRSEETHVCERWCIMVLLMQVSLVYIYAGIAKLYPDWYEGRPVELWFTNKADYPFIGKILQFEYVKKSVVYGGLFFDLLIVPLLLWTRTRVFGFVLGLVFHIFNAAVFLIGIFPFLMISLNILFFPSAGIRKFFFRKKALVLSETNYSHGLQNKSRLIFPVIVVYFLIQLYLPVRHLFYEGNVYWTEEGHRMAWHMMVRTKTGQIYFKLLDPASGKSWLVFPEEKLTTIQYKSLAISPDMIWQYADYLKKQYNSKGIRGIQIYAIGMASLNGRKPQALVDSTVDLAKVKWSHFSHSAWILPLEK
jgi:vitamin K-dependent gamma-carboxylase